MIGVEPTEAPTLTIARAHGGPADAPAGGVAADALAPRRVGTLVFPIAAEHVHDVALVEDDAILAAQRVLWDELRLRVEPAAAAVGVAALRTGVYRMAAGERVAVILSGANTTTGAVSD